MKAVIPAAGLGTRFLPATKAQPKEMLPVFDKPTIQYVVEEAVAAGIEDILIITGKGKRSIEDHFDSSCELSYSLKKSKKYDSLHEINSICDLADIYYVRQKRQLGLGDAVAYAKKHVKDEPFAVLLGDTITKSHIPCTKQLLDAYHKYSASSIAVERVPEEKIQRYGIIKGHKIEDNIYKIEDMVEKPKISEAPSDMGIIGRYVLDPSIFDCLKQVKPGYGGEIQLTDALRLLDQAYGCVFQGRTYDIGNKVDWLKTSLEFAMDNEEYKADIIEHIKAISMSK